jgi:basic membrane protein A
VAGGCGLGALQAAGDKGIYSIGVETDQKTANPSVIVSAIKRFDVASYKAIKEVVDGNFSGHSETLGLDNDGVGYALGNIALIQDIQDKVKAVSDQIKSGALTVPDTLS